MRGGCAHADIVQGRNRASGRAGPPAASSGGVARAVVSGSPRPRDRGRVSAGVFACPKGWQVSVALWVDLGGGGC